jgi:hypothetical protein
VKLCPKCDTRKPLPDFGRNRCTADGMQAWCKRCSNQASAVIAWRNSLRREADIPFPTVKTCPRCRETKPARAFNRAHGKACGLGSYCRDCSTAYQAEIRARQAAKGKP